VDSLKIVEFNVFVQAASQLLYAVKGVQVQPFVLEVSPEALREDVVECTSSSIHAYGNALLLQQASEGLRCELRPLVRIEDFRCAEILQCLLQGIDAEVNAHGVRQPVGQHPAAVPVDNGRQIHEAEPGGDVCDVGAPHVVGAGHIHVLEQIRIGLVPRMRFAGHWSRGYPMYAHPAHQFDDAFPADRGSRP